MAMSKVQTVQSPQAEAARYKTSARASLLSWPQAINSSVGTRAKASHQQLYEDETESCQPPHVDAASSQSAAMSTSLIVGPPKAAKNLQS